MNTRTLVMLAILAAGCGGKRESKNEEEYVANSAAGESNTAAAADPVAIGEALVKQNDCTTCHHRTNTLIGPSHTAVAQKYDFTKENVKLLADKIMKGGSGVWGQVPMAAHVGLSQEDAESMARYVLSLDGEKEK
jgi:cytochrome c